MKNKKLVINKDVITKLNDDQMNKVKGGECGWTNVNSGAHSCHITDCVLDIGEWLTIL